MHELSLCLNMVELIEQQAKQHGAQRVTQVWLELGALACIEEQALRFGFASATRGTLAENSELRLSHLPARAWCWDCSQSVEIEQHASPCPQCGGHKLHIENGDSLRIKQLEIE
ncbi:hydrogenase maturation nickel metallochaperone HypA [Buttiauxella izardii]|uniref:Hydrogenase maturation factor HypA n=1 Tax=Buttiauxella izardii TaxID=82991 RepID=A0A3A5K062_9ENTR|nr:hydrogenase maturation nickel metallochaperone HypA [Buttiauxella izardii]RJT28067.1 hydrogenase maturation nickel metallochaperone HypA [Buttiauxella izardii]